MSMGFNYLITNSNAADRANQEMEIIAPGNTAKGQNGNWRFYIDSSNAFIVQKRIGGAWQNVDKKQKT
jgi:hypothetical protein